MSQPTTVFHGARTLHSRRVPARLAVTSLAVAALTVAVLTGCQPEPAPQHTSDRTPGASATPPSSGTPQPSDTATAAPIDEQATPVTVKCSDLVLAQTVYDFNPNFGLLDRFTPDAGTFAARAVADRGIACRWLNQTSGDTLDFSVAQPSPAGMAELRSSAKAGQAVQGAGTGFGDEAYFSTRGAVGMVQVFSGGFWLTATSVYFSTAADAEALLADAVSAVD